MRSLLPLLLALSFAACDRKPAPAPIAQPLDTYWPTPAFTLTDQTGATLSNVDLQGKVWVADFFFTQCPLMCPILSSSMGQVRDAIAPQLQSDNARLVGFSLQPEHDTPQVLADHAQKIGAVAGQWHLLTGDRDTLWKLSEVGFKLAVDFAPNTPDNPITHTGKLILVDRTGTLRGYYDGLNTQDVDRLIRDTKQLLRQDQKDQD
ncbi:MAG: SCO family protein [Algisphaera sp.]